MRRAAHVLLAGAALVVLPPGPTAAQTAPIVTDRPSFTSAPTVVGPRMVQIETGWTSEWDRPGSDTATRLSAPNTLVRLGMSTGVEVRIETEGWVRTSSGRPGRDAVSSASDVALALEYQFVRAEQHGFDVAVIAGSSLPVGGAASTGNADPFVRLVWNRPGARTSVGGTFNWAVPSADSERTRALDASLVVGRALWGAWSVFGEGVAQHRDVDADATTWLANAGLQRAIGPNLQVDAWVGRGLNDTATDWRAGAGVSWRIRR